MSLEKICSVADIPPGHAKGLNIKNYEIAVFNIDGNFYAINRKCTHLKGNLDKGKLNGTTISCPLHGATYDLKDGKLLSQPLSIAGWFKKASDTQVYKVEVKDGELYIQFPE